MSGAVAHVGPNMPIDLLRASGRHAGSLPFDPDRPTPTADGWMESKFAPWARSILEGWAAGDYDHLGQVVFSRAEDSVQRLYYYLCELQRRGLVAGPQALILDIAKIPRESSLDRTTDCLRSLADELGVDGATLVPAIEQCNRERDNFAPAQAERACLLCGTPQPDERLYSAIEQAGFAPVGQTLPQTWAALGPRVELAEGDPIAALGRQVHFSPDTPRAFVDAGAQLRAEIAACAPQAVVLWQIEEDESQAWHLPAQRAALAASGLPSLVMTRRDWLARDGAAEEIAAFLQGVPQ
jgi:hypothetical protein